MEFLSAHPITIALAVISAVIWSAGNREQNKKYVWIGIALSVAAMIAFAFGE